MRAFTLTALMLCLLFVPCAGCGKSQPDPRDRPGFVDTSTKPTAVGVPYVPGKAGGQAKQPGAPGKK